MPKDTEYWKLRKEVRKQIEKEEAKDNLRALRECASYSKKRTLRIISKKIKEFENFYPKDIFRWDNKEKLDFNRGRFNKHCFEIVENVREHILKIIEESN